MGRRQYDDCYLGPELSEDRGHSFYMPRRPFYVLHNQKELLTLGPEIYVKTGHGAFQRLPAYLVYTPNIPVFRIMEDNARYSVRGDRSRGRSRSHRTGSSRRRERWEDLPADDEREYDMPRWHRDKHSETKIVETQLVETTKIDRNSIAAAPVEGESRSRQGRATEPKHVPEYSIPPRCRFRRSSKGPAQPIPIPPEEQPVELSSLYRDPEMMSRNTEATWGRRWNAYWARYQQALQASVRVKRSPRSRDVWYEARTAPLQVRRAGADLKPPEIPNGWVSDNNRQETRCERLSRPKHEAFKGDVPIPWGPEARIRTRPEPVHPTPRRKYMHGSVRAKNSSRRAHSWRV